MLKVICVDKSTHASPNSHLGILALGWQNPANGARGKYTREEMVKWIEGGEKAYTQDEKGNKAFLVVRVSSLGNKYVQTVADGELTDNLLSLNSCPSSLV